MTDHQLRNLRAQVYGECTDRNWTEVRANWARPDSINWLKSRPPIVPMFPSDFLPKKERE